MKTRQHVREKTEYQSSVSLPYIGSASHKIERILKEAGIQLYHSSENKLFRSLCTHKDIALMNFRNPVCTAFHVNVVWYILVKLAEISHYVLKNIGLTARKPSYTTLSERVILLGETGLNTTSNLTRYIISAAKFAAWKKRNSRQFNTAMKTPCLQYFKTYVSNRLNLEFSDMERTQFQTLWCVNGVLGKVTGSKFVCLL